MKTMKNVTAAVLLAVVVIVVFQNTEVVETKLLLVTISMPRALLLFLTLLIGVIIGLLLGTKLGRPPKRE